MSLRLIDLSRWPIPTSSSPRDNVFICSPKEHVWEIMPIHHIWLQECTKRYGFGDINETVRHLIYVCNSETKPTKKLIFRIIRCLHCHVGARGGQHRKVSVPAVVHQFQWLWLRSVTEKCQLSSIEKCLRIICDFYQSRVKEVLIQKGQSAANEKEKDIFGRNRSTDCRFLSAIGFKKKIKEKDGDNELVVNGGYDTDVAGSDGCRKNQEADPSACSDQDVLDAIKRCQVGRNSASYALALGESAEETAARRAKERIIEESDEAKRNRALIRKVLHM